MPWTQVKPVAFLRVTAPRDQASSPNAASGTGSFMCGDLRLIRRCPSRKGTSQREPRLGYGILSRLLTVHR